MFNIVVAEPKELEKLFSYTRNFLKFVLFLILDYYTWIII